MELRDHSNERQTRGIWREVLSREPNPEQTKRFRINKQISAFGTIKLLNYSAEEAPRACVGRPRARAFCRPGRRLPAGLGLNTEGGGLSSHCTFFSPSFSFSSLSFLLLPFLFKWRCLSPFPSSRLSPPLPTDRAPARTVYTTFSSKAVHKPNLDVPCALDSRGAWLARLV